MAPKRLIDDLPSSRTFSDAEEESDFETLEEDPEIDNLMRNSDDEHEEQTHEDEEEDEEQEGEEEDDDEGGEAIPSPIVSRHENSLEKDSGFVSDSDSEKTQSSPSASAFTIKPILRKSASESTKPKKSSHKSSLDYDATVKPVSSGSKRPPIENNFNGNEPNKKKIKRVMNGEDIEEGKKVSGSGINRLWSEDDEISILQGMIDFQLAKGSDPYTDMSQFLEFIKENLSVEVSKNQLIDKVRRLKKKYKNNSEKGRNGDDPVFLKQHEHKSFVLSKKIWGNEAKKKPRKQSVKASNSVSISSPGVDMVEAAKKEAVNVESKILPEEFLSEYPWLKASFMVENDKLCSEGLMRLVRERMPLIGSEKAKELDEKWRKLGESELELYLKKVELVREQCKLILDSMGKAAKRSA